MRRHSWDLPIIFSWCVIPRLLLNSILMVFWLWLMSWWKRLWLFIRTSNDPTEQHDSKQEPCQGPEARVGRGCNDSNMNRLGAHDLFRWNRVNMRTTPIKWQHVSSGVGQHQHQHVRMVNINNMVLATLWKSFSKHHCICLQWVAVQVGMISTIDIAYKKTPMFRISMTPMLMYCCWLQTPPPGHPPPGRRVCGALMLPAPFLYMLYCYTTDYYTYRTVARSSVNRWRKTLWCCFSFWAHCYLVRIYMNVRI